LPMTGNIIPTIINEFPAKMFETSCFWSGLFQRKTAGCFQPAVFNREIFPLTQFFMEKRMYTLFEHQFNCKELLTESRDHLAGGTSIPEVMELLVSFGSAISNAESARHLIAWDPALAVHGVPSQPFSS